MPDDDRIVWVPIDKIRMEPGAQELASSPEMRPYIEFAKALLQGTDPAAELDALRQVPLGKRYIWRIASALRWGFADFDSRSVKADVATMTPEDLHTVMNLLRSRPRQFCYFLKALVGAEEMERIMLQAIGAAKG